MRFLSALLVSFIAQGCMAETSQFVGTWMVEPVSESKDQFPYWHEIKYPAIFEVYSTNRGYGFKFTDQFGFSCSGVPLLANESKEIVFEYCGGGTKNPINWAPIHHAKIVNGELQGVVTSSSFLFKWVGKRQ